MEYKSVKGFGGWAQFGFLLVFMGVGFMLAFFAQLGILLKMMPAGASITDADAMMKSMLAPQNISYARALQIIGTFLLFFVPALLWSIVSNGRNLFWLGFNKYINVKQVLIAFFLILAASVATAPLADITKSIIANMPTLNAMAKSLEDTYNAQVVALSNLTSPGEYILALVIMAFLPAVFEEAFFRGAMQNLFTRWWKNPLLAIVFTAFWFSVIHMSIYLFISRLLLGIVLGYMYHKTKNLWVNIIAHFMNNAIAVSQMYYLGSHGKKADPTSVDPNVPWGFALIGLAATAGLFILLNRVSANKRLLIAQKEEALIAAQDPFRSFTNPANN